MNSTRAALAIATCLLALVGCRSLPSQPQALPQVAPHGLLDRVAPAERMLAKSKPGDLVTHHYDANTAFPPLKSLRLELKRDSIRVFATFAGEPAPMAGRWGALIFLDAAAPDPASLAAGSQDEAVPPTAYRLPNSTPTLGAIGPCRMTLHDRTLQIAFPAEWLDFTPATLTIGCWAPHDVFEGIPGAGGGWVMALDPRRIERGLDHDELAVSAESP